MSERQSVIEEKEFDLRQFLMKYLRYWYVFAVCIVLAVGAAWFYNWYTSPVYRVAGKLLIKDEAPTPARALLKDLEMSGQAKNLENEIEILRSHKLVSKALEQLEFEVSYFLVGNIKTSEVYLDAPFKVEIDSLHHFAFFTPFSVKIIDADRFGWSYQLEGQEAVSQTGRFGEPFEFPLGRILLKKREHFNDTDFNRPDYEKRNFELRFHGIERLRNAYINKLSIAPISGQSTIVEVAVLDEVPQKGVDFINTLVGVYLQNDINEKNRTADNTSVFIAEQLDKISMDLRTIESAREAYKTEKGIVDLSAESQVVLETARKIDDEIAANNAKKTMISYLKEYVLSKNSMSDVAPTTININDPLLNGLIEKLYKLESEREKMNVSSTKQNPQLVPLEAEIALTRSMLIENIRNIEKTIDLANDDLEDEMNKVKGRIQRIPKTERELITIERQYRIQESLYLYLLEKQAEVSISLASSVSDNRIVDKARASAGPVKPVKSKAYSIALIIGLLVPVVLVYLREQLDDYVRDLDTIDRLTGIPIIGLVGVSRETSNLVIGDKPNSLIAEAYRSVRTNLRFFGMDEQNKVLLITSSVGTEGKTFTAMNLSSVLALSGKKTVLLGLDLRKPRIIDDFNLTNDKGISTYLSGEHGLTDVVQPSKLIDGFDIIPSGPVPPNPSELIMGQRMDQLIAELSERYDYVIIDSPPVGLVTDALILMKHASLSLFVVRQGVTRKQHLRHIRQMTQKQDLGPVAILFNAVKFGRAVGGNGYGYGYHYGYGYGGGYGYYDDKGANKGIFERVRRVFSKS